MLPLITGSYLPKNTSSHFSNFFKTLRITNKTKIIKNDFEMSYRCKTSVVLFFFLSLATSETNFDSVVQCSTLGNINCCVDQEALICTLCCDSNPSVHKEGPTS